MVSLQILSKILATKDLSILRNNNLTRDYFVGYEKEIDFITEHAEKYGTVPDKTTFLSHFVDEQGNPTIELVEVGESDKYLVDAIREEYLYYKSIPVVQKIAELLKTDANAAAEYMVHAVKDLQPKYQLGGVDIIANALDRYDQFVARKTHPEEWFFSTGLDELDELINGLKRLEELLVIYARTNHAKSWLLEKICKHVWECGNGIGYIEPEMSETSVGYRFDTLHAHFSNTGLTWAKDTIDEAEYLEYLKNLKNTKTEFVVATPKDFNNRRVTVSAIRNWIVERDLKLVAIDGIKYMTDERYKKGDNTTTSLTNICEDLMSLSVELHVPILIVVQANRSGVVQGDSDDMPELESIRDSDGISHNASKVLALRLTKEGILKIAVKKNRDGSVGGKLNYQVDLDTGDFVFVPSEEDAEPQETTEKKTRETKRTYAKKDSSDVF